MNQRRRTAILLVTLTSFLLVTLFINFFHTEKEACESDSCVACHFIHSSLAIGAISFFHLPRLQMLEILVVIDSFRPGQLDISRPFSRSPPLI